MGEMDRFVAACRAMGEPVPEPEDLVAVDGGFNPRYYGTPEDVAARYRLFAFNQTLFFDADGRFLGALYAESLPEWVGRKPYP